MNTTSRMEGVSRGLDELGDIEFADRTVYRKMILSVGGDPYWHLYNESVSPEVKNGIAHRSTLEAPLTTPFGTFHYRYEYAQGCQPLREFSKGIGVIFCMATSRSGEGRPDLIFEIAEQPQDTEGYRILTHRIVGDDLRLMADVTINQPLLPASLVKGMPMVPEAGSPYAEQSIFAKYGGFAAAGAVNELDLSTYVITDIQGVTNREYRETIPA